MIPLPDGKQSANKYSRFLADNEWVATYVNGTLCSGLPYYLTKQDKLRLDISLYYPNITRDIKVLEDGIHCTLLFRHEPYNVFLPWSAVIEFIDHCKANARRDEDMNKNSLLPKNPIIAKDGNVIIVRFGKYR